MNRIRLIHSVLIAPISAILFIGCAAEKMPSRDQIPIIKERVSRLQEGILAKNTAAIDSLMSVNILKKGQTSDSLLSIVYGSNNENGFDSFGLPEIMYTDDFASIQVVMNDSSRVSTRAITYTLEYDDGQWLLIDYKSGQADKSK